MKWVFVSLACINLAYFGWGGWIKPWMKDRELFEMASQAALLDQSESIPTLVLLSERKKDLAPKKTDKSTLID